MDNLSNEQTTKTSFKDDAVRIKSYVGDQIKSQIKSQAKNFVANLFFSISDSISNGIKNAIQMALFNETAPKNYNSNSSLYSQTGYINYSKSYTMPNRYAEPQAPMLTPQELYSRNVYSYDNIEFNTEAEANYALSVMNQEIRRRGYVEVAVLYREAKQQYTYADMNWGWNDLNSVRAQRKMNGKWSLLLPRAIEISKE